MFISIKHNHANERWTNEVQKLQLNAARLTLVVTLRVAMEQC
jgi:hypothetical protein